MSGISTIQLDESWRPHLIEEFDKDYLKYLKSFLLQEMQLKKTIYPHPKNFFKALDLTPLEQVKVVILGQDPYHGPDQAHGLSFSVPKGVRIPPSLQNIYKELQSDLGITPPNHGFLQSWAEQGVLLLNATLSVEASKAGSHQKKGWEEFTDKIIEVLNQEKKNLAFILWGSYAQKKGAHIDAQKHFVLKSPHPSPLSAHRGFLGSRPFSKVNHYLETHGLGPIAWEKI